MEGLGMPKQSKKVTQTFWAVYNPYSKMVYPHFSYLRKEAINEYLYQISNRETWKELQKEGYKAIKVTIIYNKEAL